MDYLEIVLRGYFDDNNRGYLENYFHREFKKAEKEHFLPDAFFGGCLDVIEKLEQNIQFKLLNRKGNTSISENDFKTHLENVPGGWGTYDIHKTELSIIKEAINKAFHEATSSNTTSSLVFFHKVLNGKIVGQLDIYNSVEEITGFDIVKLKALREDLEMYLDTNYWETIDEISQEEIDMKLSNLEKNKILEWVMEGEKKIPKRKIFEKKNEKIISSMKTIDIEDMFFSGKYIYIRHVINFLQRKIREIQDKDKHKKPNKNIKGKGLSVSDWTIIFYYLYEAGEKKETKTNGFEKIIKDNEINTTLNNFKKEYYEIVRRINRTKNSKGKTLPPLPPERIEKILPFIKINTKAKRIAKNDIEHLTNELQKYNDNDY